LKINIIEFQDAKRVPCTCSPEWIGVSGTTFKQVSSLQEEFHNLFGDLAGSSILPERKRLGSCWW
jgi:hypothetical protein